MSAQSIQVTTLDFTDPATQPSASGRTQRVNSSISYAYDSHDVRTLSTNSATTGSDRVGYLYVPALDLTDSCFNASSPYVPSNVTRINDLPSTFPLVGLAPWISPDCTLAYLNSARKDNVDALLFFLPNSTSGMPPLANDAAWGLGDGGQWKQNNPYPVYAISAPDALQLLNESSLYSGTIAEAPHGSNLTAVYGPHDIIRLSVDINLGSTSSGIPSIWVFLLIILAVLLLAVAVVSCVMHAIQRRRRQVLRTRIAAGQIDLEALGVKKLTVPQQVIDKMPIYTYVASSPPNSSTVTDLPPEVLAVPDEQVIAGSELVWPALYQPVCAICLDDFIVDETQVRELPCRHIFHPSCIDGFLLQNSSLCPLCKKSTLPAGYCPDEVSNVMVRRERDLRRSHLPGVSEVNPATERQTRDPVVVDAHTAPINTAADPSVDASPVPTSNRSEWARRRAVAMLGHRASVAATDDNTVRPSGSMPRRLLRRVFPGIG